MDWISIDDCLPENRFKKYLVKKENGEIIQAFFMPDKGMWINFYGIEPSYWMEFDSPKLIYNVTHWMTMPKQEKREELSVSSV